MHRWLFSGLLAVLLAGCGTHYHRSDGNEVTLILRKFQAKQVVLACSLDGFKSHAAERVSGRWVVRLPADEAFTYFYRVDGIPFLPDCPLKESDDFGSHNCIFDPDL